jgi:hypothetical protein
MAVAVLPAASNVYVANHEASGKLVVDYARNPKRFAVNQYIQITPVDQIIGLFQQMTIEERGRILTSDAAEYAFADGADAPLGADGTEYFIWQQFLARRYAYSFLIGQMTGQQATWDVVAQHAGIHAQKAMTNRTLQAYNQLSTSTNYSTGHVSAVFGGTISGTSGTWTQSTVARGDIKRSLEFAIEKILDDTLAGIEPGDLHLVIGTAQAALLTQSQEIVDYIKSSPDAYAELRGELPNRNYWYGLPSKLYGVNITVDATRRVTSQKLATRAASAIFGALSSVGSLNAFLVARPGGLVGVANAPSFSFLQNFVYKQFDMVVEVKNDDDNKRIKGRVIDCFTMQGVAPQSGFWFQNAL